MEKFLDKAPPKSRVVALILIDIFMIMFSMFMGLFVRFELSFAQIPIKYMTAIWKYAPIHVVCTLLIFAVFRLYGSLWKFASATELINIIGACFTSGVIEYAGMKMLKVDVPRSYHLIYMTVLAISVAAIRFSYRILRIFQEKRLELKNEKVNRVMLIGAGDAGALISKELQNSRFLSNSKIVCIIDDDYKKVGKYFRGVQITGGRSSILDGVAKYKVDEIIIAMPSASNKKVKEILDICKETGCKLRILPGMYQLINGEVNVSKLREVQIEDLLGRDPISVDLNNILEYVSDKVVVVTGGGGSIGSELCRQIAAKGPRQLILIDIYENNAYDVQQELKHKFPNLNLIVLIASVRNKHRLYSIFKKYNPDIVYHAAAHKHVPLMEDSPNEAIKNNVFGTLKTVMAADKYGVEKFVLISTDKAVNPTNIMGASKRICEMIIQMFAHSSKTEFVAVRFGNVLGSNGSVIPLFKKQIAEGGPVTVTHPDIIRYFMTIPEAVSLVLQAGAYAKGGEIFILDMGEPVKIVELAKNLIKLSGYRPDEDIKIVFTGLRPGEKLYEELLMDDEGLQETPNKLIHIGKPIDFDEELFVKQLEDLEKECLNDSDEIKKYVQNIVSTYVRKEN
jgi:FlaA1/EpsC-like NDP-sugar epimerase